MCVCGGGAHLQDAHAHKVGQRCVLLCSHHAQQLWRLKEGEARQLRVGGGGGGCDWCL